MEWADDVAIVQDDQLTFQIPIAGLPAGLYFVRVIKDGQTYTEKLIKN